MADKEVPRVTVEYEAVEHEALKTLHAFLRSDGADPALLAKAKVAQGTLGSVQSHNRTEVARNVLNFEMARSLTTDPAVLADYIRVTQPPASPILKALPPPVADAKTGA